jgi:hypothetical protein
MHCIASPQRCIPARAQPASVRTQHASSAVQGPEQSTRHARLASLPQAAYAGGRPRWQQKPLTWRPCRTSRGTTTTASSSKSPSAESSRGADRASLGSNPRGCMSTHCRRCAHPAHCCWSSLQRGGCSPSQQQLHQRHVDDNPLGIHHTHAHHQHTGDTSPTQHQHRQWDMALALN